MPKKRKKARTPRRRDERLPPLLLSPARTLLELIAMGADEEALKIAAHWPYQVERGEPMSIMMAAESAGTSPREAAVSMAQLEEMGMLAWESESNRYLLTAPESQ